jgi:hypothetical protein
VRLPHLVILNSKMLRSQTLTLPATVCKQKRCTTVMITFQLHKFSRMKGWFNKSSQRKGFSHCWQENWRFQQCSPCCSGQSQAFRSLSIVDPRFEGSLSIVDPMFLVEMLVGGRTVLRSLDQTAIITLLAVRSFLWWCDSSSRYRSRNS